MASLGGSRKGLETLSSLLLWEVSERFPLIVMVTPISSDGKLRKYATETPK